MGTVPTTDNQAAEILDQVISLLMSGGLVAAEAYLTSLAPEVLSLPVIAWIMDQGLSYVAQIVSVAGQKFATQIVVDIQTHGEKSSVITTATALQFALSSGNQTDIDLATKNASTAWGNLIHYDGSAQPVPIK